MIKTIVALCLLLCLSLTQQVSGFQTPLPVRASSSTSLQVFGKKKSAPVNDAETAKYWQGEWVCKDCGYIYNRAVSFDGIELHICFAILYDVDIF
jgi:hypothetical protein